MQEKNSQPSELQGRERQAEVGNCSIRITRGVNSTHLIVPVWAQRIPISFLDLVLLLSETVADRQGDYLTPCAYVHGVNIQSREPEG